MKGRAGTHSYPAFLPFSLFFIIGDFILDSNDQLRRIDGQPGNESRIFSDFFILSILLAIVGMSTVFSVPVLISQ